MRRLLQLVAAMAPVLAAPFVFGEIAGSPHDFSASAWGDQAICKPCHTPHNAIESGITGRLWAHTLSTATYTYHGTGTKPTDGITSTDSTSTIGQSDMDGATRLCLSCHDGTVALDSFMGKDGAADGLFIGDAGGQHGALTANLGVNLSNDHPVGFKALYKENSGSAGHYRYKPVATATAAGIRFAISPTAATGNAQDGTTPLTGNWPSVSCVSCHDVHNGSLPTEPGLLRVTNEGSTICLSCHNK